MTTYLPPTAVWMLIVVGFVCACGTDAGPSRSNRSSPPSRTEERETPVQKAEQLLNAAREHQRNGRHKAALTAYEKVIELSASSDLVTEARHAIRNYTAPMRIHVRGGSIDRYPAWDTKLFSDEPAPPDPYVEVQVNARTVIRTSTVRDSYEAVWGNVREVTVRLDDNIAVFVWDSDGFGADLIDQFDGTVASFEGRTGLFGRNSDLEVRFEIP